MIEADGHPCIVFGQIVDSVGNAFAVGLPREVVGGYLDRFTTGMPFFTGLGVPSYQFLFLGVHTDHRVAAGENCAARALRYRNWASRSGCWRPSRVLRVA